MTSDGVHLTSFGIVVQTEEAEENERSPSIALLWAGLLRRDIVYEQERVMQVCELEQVLRVCDGFFSSMSVTYDGVVLL